MLKWINSRYVNFYKRYRIKLFLRFRNNYYYQRADYIFRILKTIWYDRVKDRVAEFQAQNLDLRTGNYQLIVKHLMNVDTHVKLRVGCLPDQKNKYKVSFVIQSKKINIDDLSSKTIGCDEKIFYVKIDNKHISNFYLKKFKDALTLSFLHKAGYDDTSFKNYKDVDKLREKIFLMLNPISENRIVKFLNSFIKEKDRKVKTSQYVKRKFGKSETVINTQHVWNAEFTLQQLLFMIDKLHTKKNDTSQLCVKKDDIIS